MLIALILAITEGDLLDNQIPAFTDVLIARYVLRRWPESWSEVEKSNLQYNGTKTDRKEFDSVKMEAVDQGHCNVTFYLHNVIGWKYSTKQVLRWTAQISDRLRREDVRWEITRQILHDIEKWVSKGHELTETHLPGAEDVKVWSVNHPRSRVVRVTLAPTSASFSLLVDFEDSVSYTISSSLYVKLSQTPISWLVRNDP